MSVEKWAEWGRDMSVDELVAKSEGRLLRKKELLEEALASGLGLAGLTSELEAMRDECRRVAAAWRRQETLGAELIRQCSVPGASVRVALSVLIQGAPVDACDFMGRSALHFALEHDNLPVASVLMDFGARPDLEDASSTRPLHVVAAVCQNPLLASLVLVGSPPASMLQNKNGWSPLHIAAFQGNAMVLRMLLTQSHVDLSIPDSEGATPLHVAVAAGHLECVRLILSIGAPLNAKTLAGDTPLHFALRLGHHQLIKTLLKAGADRTLKNAAGVSAIQALAAFGETVHQVEQEIAAHLSTDLDLPLKLVISPSVPEARSHHFLVDTKAVEAVADTYVTFVLRTAPPRMGLRFVTRCESNFGTKITYGSTLDHRNGKYSVTYRHPEGDKADITVALVEGGEVVAKRGFSVTTTKPRVVGRFCCGFGPGLYNPQPGPNTFSLRLRNQCGTNYDSGGVEGLSVVVKKSDQTTVAAVLQDHGNGVYTVKMELPNAGIVAVDAMFQNQSIMGFPVELNMDQVAKMMSLVSQRKVEEDISYYQTKLALVEAMESNSSPAMRRTVRRTCVACERRDVCALLLPCRHYRFCASCAKGNVVLATPCNVCGEPSQGFIVARNDGA